MSKTVLNVKTDLAVKKAAQKLSKEMGIPLSLVVTNSLKRFIADRQLIVDAPLIPSARLRKTITQYQKDKKKGSVEAASPAFASGAEMDAWLEGNL